MRVALAAVVAASVCTWSPASAWAAAPAELGGWTAVSFTAADDAPALPAWPVLWTADPQAPGLDGQRPTPVRRLTATSAASTALAAADAQGSAPQKAFEYSDGYLTRRKIHYIASFATLPLFVTEYILGEQLFDGTAGSGTRDAHAAVAGVLGGLFAVNTVTGVWNAWEARKDPNGRGKRLLHTVLMLAADAGFAATGALAPDSEDGNYLDDRGTHRNVALVSMGTATVGYLIMLFGR